ncbi:universal stress protein [Arthrobacter pigmenti]
MNVVVGYVPNERGQAAFHAALDLAGPLGLKVQVLNASNRQSAVDPDLASQAELDGLAAKATKRGLGFEIIHPADTDGTSALIEISEAEETRMMVIGIRNRSKVGKLIMGSSAQHILLEAQCPVLAVKAES